MQLRSWHSALGVSNVAPKQLSGFANVPATGQLCVVYGYECLVSALKRIASGIKLPARFAPSRLETCGFLTRFSVRAHAATPTASSLSVRAERWSRDFLALPVARARPSKSASLQTLRVHIQVNKRIGTVVVYVYRPPCVLFGWGVCRYGIDHVYLA